MCSIIKEKGTWVNTMFMVRIDNSFLEPVLYPAMKIYVIAIVQAGGNDEEAKVGSDITEQDYEAIKPFLETARKKTRPRKVDLYEVFCAILYVLKEGCRWRALPHDFPRWDRVYKYFQQWS